MALLGEGSIKSWSRVATLGRRGELPAELGVFFREPLQLRGRILSAFGLRIAYSVFKAQTPSGSRSSSNDRPKG